MYSDDNVLSFCGHHCKSNTPSSLYPLFDLRKGVQNRKRVSVQSAQTPLTFARGVQPPLDEEKGSHADQPSPLQIQRLIEENQNGISTSCDDLLQSLCARGQLDKALHALAETSMFTPSISSYLSVLQACIKFKSLAHVKQVYAHISSHRVPLTGVLGDYLAMALAKCGDVEDARQVASSLPHLTVFSWTAIISAYAEQGLGQEALELHHLMLDQGVYPDQYTFVSLFRACSNISDLTCGRELHAEACMKGFTSNVFVNNSLMTMYGKQGPILDAEKVFELTSSRNVVSWNAMLSAYVEQEHVEKALRLYRQMQEERLDSNQQTFVIVLQACVLFAEKEEACLMEGVLIKAKAFSIGEALHSDARSKGFVFDIYVGTALCTMYGKCGAIARAENLFSILPQRSVISWNSMLSSFIGQRQGRNALILYRFLHEEGVIADALTIVLALQACGIHAEDEDSIKQVSLQIGQAVHVDVCIKGLELDVFIATALLGMYSKCGSVLIAENIFIEFPGSNIVLRSAMMAAYIEQGLGQKALVLYMQMQEEGIAPSVQILVLAIQASGAFEDNEEVSTDSKCIKLVSLEVGHTLHTYAFKIGFDLDIQVSTALVSMYGKCGSTIEAEHVFKAMCHPDVVTYTALFSAYVSEGCPEQALALYKKIPKQHLILDEVTLIYILQACGETGSLEVCEELYFIIVAAGYDNIASVVTVLVRTYGDCASMSDGHSVFDGLSKPGIMPWTACIMGHAGYGNIEASLSMLEQLNLAGLIPDEITVSAALLACGHFGNTTKALNYFNSMNEDCNISLHSKHYGIMVELLGRAGDFQRIEELLSEMHAEADVSIWVCLLGAFCAHNRMDLAREAFNQILSLQPNQTSAYILMSNMYADLVLE